MMTVKRFGVFSVGKISGILYAVMGLFFGVLWASIAFFDPFAYGPLGLPIIDLLVFSEVLFWLVGIISIAVIYGIIGFLSGLIGAALYNVFARWIGGIKVELNPDLGGKL